jgi:hypothetical protein
VLFSLLSLALQAQDRLAVRRTQSPCAFPSTL